MRLFFVLTAIFLSSFLAESASASQWSLLAGSGSYMGETHLGIHYLSSTGRHGVDLSYGQTQGEASNNVDQLNVKYLYSPFFVGFGDLKTNVLGIGILASRWQSSAGFIDSPGQYPADNYYSPTRWRFGLVLGQTWTYRWLSLYLDWVLLDQVAIALYNNDRFVEGASAWSGGFGVRWGI